MSHLQLKSLRKRFAGNQALDGVDVSLEQGELVSLLGPSGCGKTTALRCVAGFLQPDEGQIVVGGDDITRLAPNRRDILLRSDRLAARRGWNEEGTAAVVKRAGYKVHLVPGSPDNLKVTYPGDLKFRPRSRS